MLVAAMNPCPCGFFGDTARTNARARRMVIQRYRSRISGPLLDRIDIHIEVPAVKYKELTENSGGRASVAIRERVDARASCSSSASRAMTVLLQRADGLARVARHCQVEAAGERLLELAINRLGPERPRLHADPQGRAHGRRSRRRRPDRSASRQRGDPVPLARPPQRLAIRNAFLFGIWKICGAEDPLLVLSHVRSAPSPARHESCKKAQDSRRSPSPASGRGNEKARGGLVICPRTRNLDR